MLKQSYVEKWLFKKAKQTKECGAQIFKHRYHTPLLLRVLQLFFGCNLKLFQDVLTYTELVPLGVTDSTV